MSFGQTVTLWTDITQLPSGKSLVRTIGWWLSKRRYTKMRFE
jgi:hypothetical protein